MHKPVDRIDRKPVGLTGEFRFRTQRFTGKQILQVGFMYEVRRYTYSNELQDPDWPFTTEIEWQDANTREAMMLSIGQAPFPSKNPVVYLDVDQYRQLLKDYPDEFLKGGYVKTKTSPTNNRHGGSGFCDHDWFYSPDGGPGIGDGYFCRHCGAAKDA